MFIIDLTYKVPLDQIDEYMERHVQFLNRYYNSGKFIASGRKVPRDGGVILATANDRKEIEDIITQDPFYQHQLADYRITEFVVGKKAQHFTDLFL
jgi:uncharacterized protein YciI